MHQTWERWLSPVLQSDKYKELLRRIEHDELDHLVLPEKTARLRVFESDPMSLKVVILGQDPYPTPGHAMGLAFSVNPDVPLPRSLRNIYRQISDDLGIDTSQRNGDLTHWEAQGVFMLNTVLSVRAGQAHSHAGWGWEELTSLALSQLSRHHPGLVFMLWGGPAQKVAAAAGVDWLKHYRLSAAHPSPLSAHRGFFGCQHFRKANEWLVSSGKDPISW